MADDRHPRKPRPSRGTPTRETKDAYFIQVTGDGEAPQYFNVSDKVGKPMPFTRPTATVAMRVTDHAVCTSLLMVSKRTRRNLSEQNLVVPEGPLARLERKSRRYAKLDPSTVVVEFEGETHTYSITRDSAGVVTIEQPDLDAEPVLFTIPKGGPKLTIYLWSAKANRVMAISSMGARYPGKPGATDSLVRATSMVLYALSQLMEFRIIAGIETVDVPPSPARWGDTDDTAPSIDVDAADASVDIPVYLFAGEPLMPRASGMLGLRIDLRNANPATGKLLMHLTPSEDIAQEFGPFRRQAELALEHLLSVQLGDADMSDMAVEIVLGGLDQEALDRLNEALGTLTAGLDLAADRVRVHGT